MERAQTFPMLLPWLAKQAGVDQNSAAILWERAARYAGARTGEIATPEHAQLAMTEFRHLLQEESLQMDIASLGTRQLLRSQANLLRTVNEAIEQALCPLNYVQRLMLKTLHFSDARKAARRETSL